jgi:hypothetical protein
LPNFAQRVVILQNMLSMSTMTTTNHDTSSLQHQQPVNFEQVAMATKGYSPSDLRHLLQTAVVNVMREAENDDNSNSQQQQHQQHQQQQYHHRPITTLDILRAMQSVPATPLSPHYQAAMARFTSSRSKNKKLMDSNQETEHDDDATDDGNDDDFSFSDYNPFRQQQPRRRQGILDSFKWETEFGNFYSLGSLEVDPQTFALLTQLAREYQEEDGSGSSSDDEENDNDQDEQEDDMNIHNSNSNTVDNDEWWSQERDRYNNDDAFQDLD